MEKLNISYPNRMRLETSGREFAAKSSPNYVQNGFNRLRTHSNLFFKCKSRSQVKNAFTQTTSTE